MKRRIAEKALVLSAELGRAIVGDPPVAVKTRRENGNQWFWLK